MVHSSGTAAALLGITALVGVVAGNRCFVCAPRTGSWRDQVMKVFPDPAGLLLCEHFHPKDKRYERDCPPEYTGCLTQTNGPHVLRMCSDLKNRINDCKMANGVQYCFCSGSDLCNVNVSQFPTRPTVSPVPQPPNDDDDEDREDLSEGSGGGGLPQTKADPNLTTAHPPHGTTTTSVSTSNGGATTIRTLCLIPLMAVFVATATVQ